MDKYTMEPIHKYWTRKNYPMTTACCRTASGLADYETEKAPHIMGLSPGHAYTLHEVKDLVGPSGQIEHTIVKLRNPWATDTWNGPWRDDDPNWTDDYRAQVGGHLSADDGQFWMDYDWFLANMYNTGVAFTESWAGVDYQTIDIQPNQDFSMVISNPSYQNFFVTAEILSSRHFPRK